MPGKLFVISAPSGAGKTSLVRALCEQDAELDMSVSHTTRPRRPGEVHGEHYHFVSDAEFERMVENEEFLEHARVFDNRYGTAKSTVNTALESGRNIVLEIDWQGARQIRRNLTDCCTIFVLPPSREELERRLRKRAQDSEQTIRRRMKAAVLEMVHYDEFDYTVINDDFDRALDALACILSAEQLKTPLQQQRQQNLIKSLLA